jgi:glyoxylase-like metal-dependent hydrolase (beta-lactamase superfamily II)
MPKMSRCAVGLVFALACARLSAAQGDPSWTEPFEPFRVAGNLYYVGTGGVSSFLFVTPAGNVLVDTGLEEAVPIVRANIEKLGVHHLDHDSSTPDIFAAQHPSIFRMEDKVKRMKAGDANPFIDREGYAAMVASSEQAYLAQLKRERGK